MLYPLILTERGRFGTGGLNGGHLGSAGGVFVDIKFEVAHILRFGAAPAKKTHPAPMGIAAH